MDEWPPGCLGFAVNLMRPAVRGHRATVLYAQLGRSLVFETMPQAARYRQLVTQVLRSSMADLFTLDGQKISGRGVVVGSSFRVPALGETAFRFGSRGGGGGGRGGSEVRIWGRFGGGWEWRWRWEGEGESAEGFWGCQLWGCLFSLCTLADFAI